MNFLKTLFSIFVAHRIMNVIITVIIGLVIFFMVTDVNFMTNLMNKVKTILDMNESAIGNWFVEFFNAIKNAF